MIDFISVNKFQFEKREQIFNFLIEIKNLIKIYYLTWKFWLK